MYRRVSFSLRFATIESPEEALKHSAVDMHVTRDLTGAGRPRKAVGCAGGNVTRRYSLYKHKIGPLWRPQELERYQLRGRPTAVSNIP